MVWSSENKKKPPFRILSMADTGIIFFIGINLLTMLNVIEIITDIGAYDLFNNEIVLGLLLIVYCLMIYFIYHAFIDRNDKYVSYFKKFRKQGFGKLFICYVISYSVTIACCCLSLSFILTK